LRRGYEPGLRPAKFPPAPVDATFSFLLIASLVVVAGMVFDWRTRRRMHPAWIIGLAVMLGGGLLRAPLAATPAWLAFADWTTRIAG
jgi:hypothetical protein